MATITVSTKDGPSISFDTARTIRVTRGIVLPIKGHLTPKTEITLGDPEQIILTDESLDDVLAKVGNSAPLVHFTAPDGSQVAINAKKITSVRKPNAFDLEGIPGPNPADQTNPISANAEIFSGHFRNFVRETVPEVKAVVRRALESPDQEEVG